MIESSDSPYIYAATSATFTALVIENSALGPVLVNFWSKKDDSCLRLYPVLENLINHYDGRALLVNVDADSEADLCKEYSIASIPSLKLFRHGKVVETLQGYQSEEDLLTALDQYVARDSDLLLADAIQLYTDGKRVEAYEKIAAAIAGDPDNHRLPLAMCNLLKHESRFAEALKLIASLPAAIKNNMEIIQFQNIIGFLLDAENIPDFETVSSDVERQPQDMNNQQHLVTHLVVREEYTAALKILATMIEREPDFDDNYPQKAMLKIFSIIGLEHELVTQFRPYLKRYTH